MRRGVCIALLALLANAAEAAPDRPKETVEAGASTRQVAITSSFTGTEILVFGAVDNSVQPSPEAGTYDIVVVAEGTSAPVIVRRKSEVGGLWVNTSSIRFASLPSYYAIASTRPIDQFASRAVLDENGIGFEHVRIIPAGSVHAQTEKPVDLSDFKDALIRLKQEQRLYVRSDYGVTFIGRSLFRATIELPPNVPIGPLVARVYLFKDGQLLSHYESHVMLERQGIERYIHDAAMQRPLLYGIATVLIAAAAGLIAAFAFRRIA